MTSRTPGLRQASRMPLANGQEFTSHLSTVAESSMPKRPEAMAQIGRTSIGAAISCYICAWVCNIRFGKFSEAGAGGIHQFGKFLFQARHFGEGGLAAFR